MGLHINWVRGDFIFYAWKDGEDKRLDEKITELNSLGYERKVEVEHDSLNEYLLFENPDGDMKKITICCN